MSWEALQQGQRQPPLPLTLELSSDQNGVTIEQWLRVLPGKRYVAQAQYQDRSVLIKVYLGSRGASKAAAEAQGIELLQAKQLPTPALIASGSNDHGAWVICQWLEQANTLSQAAELSVEGLSTHTPPLTEAPTAAREVAALLQQMHQLSIVQADIHPANFLYAEQQWWIVDAADISETEDSNAQRDNLGVFLAQLPQAWAATLLRSYGLTPQDETPPWHQAMEKCHRWRSWRAEDLARKSLRDCTLFAVTHDFTSFQSQWRDEAADLPDFDASLEQGKLLKDGGSATVGLIEYAGRQLVLKRYNLKNWRHWLKRFWRPTRAWHSWTVGHRLRVLGVPTPKPIAMQEERHGPLRGRGYLLTERAPSSDIIEACTDESVTRDVAEQIASVLQVFIREKISHGDFKGTNLLWDGRLHLIDLDAVQWHSNPAKWRRAFDKDIKRLLRNWPEGSMQHRIMSEVITESIEY